MHAQPFALTAPLDWHALASRLVPAALRRQYQVALFMLHQRLIGEAELAHLGQLVEPGALAIDIGAHAGLYSWALARLGARVIAFEPNPAMASVVAVLADPRITIHCEAVSDRRGAAVLTLPGNNASLATLETTATTGPSMLVRTVALDDMRLDPVGFIKIDVEGHEEAVLAGAAGLIARDRPALLIEVEERHNPGGLQRVAARLDGYHGWFLRGVRWRPLASFDPARDQDAAAILQSGLPRPRRARRYVNNFLFLPQGRTPPGSHA